MFALFLAWKSITEGVFLSLSLLLGSLGALPRGVQEGGVIWDVTDALRRILGRG